MKKVINKITKLNIVKNNESKQKLVKNILLAPINSKAVLTHYRNTKWKIIQHIVIITTKLIAPTICNPYQSDNLKMNN